MATISQTIFSNAFSWMNLIEISLKFVPKADLSTFHFRNAS